MRTALTLLVLLLGACTGPYVSDMLRDPVVDGYPRRDTTYLMFNPAAGFSVEYFAADGASWLWVPGAGGLVPGVWRIEDPLRRPDRDLTRDLDSDAVKEAAVKHLSTVVPIIHAASVNLCRRYGTRAAQALADNEWECLPARRLADEVAAVMLGDPFNLSLGAVPPQPLERCRAPPQFTRMKEVWC